MHTLTTPSTRELIDAVRRHSALQGERADTLGALGAMLDRMGLDRVLLVIDRDAVSACDAGGLLRDQMGERCVGEFDGFAPNPTSDQAAAAARAIRSANAQGVVAIGGGSCMDVGKVGALAAATGADRLVATCEGAPAGDTNSLPVIAIPTTSGTGSEATHFAAIYVQGRKVSVVHPSMRPAGVVLDFTLHMKMPTRLAAATGLDALCQSLESMWAVGSTDESLDYAKLGGALVGAHLVESVRTASGAAREAMMWGAHAAGMAINISKTTAPHALSYQLTSRFGVPHGIAAALSLGYIGRENGAVTDQDCSDPRGAEWVRSRVRDAAATLSATCEQFPAAVSSLLREVGVPCCLRAAGVDRSSISVLAARVDPVRLSNNPRRLSVDRLAAVLDGAWEETDLVGSQVS